MNLTSDQMAYIASIAVPDQPEDMHWLKMVTGRASVRYLIINALKKATPDEWTQITAMVLGAKDE